VARHGGGNYRRQVKDWAILGSFRQGMTADATFVSMGLGIQAAQTVLRMLGEYIIGPTSAPVA